MQEVHGLHKNTEHESNHIHMRHCLQVPVVAAVPVPTQHSDTNTSVALLELYMDTRMTTAL
eukprot:6193207-Pleurochrysis_carterae.AAC.3